MIWLYIYTKSSSLTFNVLLFTDETYKKILLFALVILSRALSNRVSFCILKFVGLKSFRLAACACPLNSKVYLLPCISSFFFLLNSRQGSQLRLSSVGTSYPHFSPQVHPVNLQPIFVHGSIGGVWAAANSFLAAWIEEGSMAILMWAFLPFCSCKLKAKHEPGSVSKPKVGILWIVVLKYHRQNSFPHRRIRIASCSTS